MSIVADLAKHLDQRINQAVTDYCERCDMMEISAEEALAHAINIFGQHYAAAAQAVGATEPEFVSLCRQNFHNVTVIVRQMEEQHG